MLHKAPVLLITPAQRDLMGCMDKGMAQTLNLQRWDSSLHRTAKPRGSSEPAPRVSPVLSLAT